jgi:hypothetical protein
MSIVDTEVHASSDVPILNTSNVIGNIFSWKDQQVQVYKLNGNYYAVRNPKTHAHIGNSLVGARIFNPSTNLKYFKDDIGLYYITKYNNRKYIKIPTPPSYNTKSFDIITVSIEDVSNEIKHPDVIIEFGTNTTVTLTIPKITEDIISGMANANVSWVVRTDTHHIITSDNTKLSIPIPHVLETCTWLKSQYESMM